MKREERRVYNSIRKNTTENTIYVEIPTTYTHEAKQAIHELLTINKGMYAIRICPHAGILSEDVILYYHCTVTMTAEEKQIQEASDIDAVVASLPVSVYSWNGYRRPGTEEEPTTEETTQTTNTTDTEKEEEPMPTTTTTRTGLRSTCKKALTNLREYILTHTDTSNYEDLPMPSTFKEAAQVIIDTFWAEYMHGYNLKRNHQDCFCDWLAGLPSVFDSCYYHNRSAVDDLGAILEESEAEKARYTDEQACKQLSWLIYREVTKATGRY